MALMVEQDARQDGHWRIKKLVENPHSATGYVFLAQMLPNEYRTRDVTPTEYDYLVAKQAAADVLARYVRMNAEVYDLRLKMLAEGAKQNE